MNANDMEGTTGDNNSTIQSNTPISSVEELPKFVLLNRTLDQNSFVTSNVNKNSLFASLQNQVSILLSTILELNTVDYCTYYIYRFSKNIRKP